MDLSSIAAMQSVRPVRPGEGNTSRVGTGIDAERIRAITEAVTNGDTARIYEALQKETSASDILLRALKEAGIATDGETLSAVEALISNRMPVDNGSITELLGLMRMFKGVSAQTLALMKNHDVLISAENVRFFDDLINNRGSLPESINTLFNAMEAAAGDGGIDAEAARRLMNGVMLSRMMNSPAVFEDRDGGQTLGEMLSRGEINNLNRLLSPFADALNKAGLFDAANDSAAPVESILAARTTPGEFIRLLYGAVSAQGQNDEANVIDLLGSRENSKVLLQLYHGEWAMRPSELSPDEKGGITGIGEFFNKISRESAILSDVMKGEQFNPVAAQIANAANTLNGGMRFTDLLNSQYAFCNFPLEINGRNAEGELYIFSDRKRIKQRNGDNLNILLKLNLDSIGELSVYLNTSGANINARFCTANAEAARLFESTMGELAAALEGCGYKLNANVQAEESGFDFLRDFIKYGEGPFKLVRHGIRIIT